jgi:tricorn protease
MPVSGAGHFSPDGKRVVYSPLWRDFRSEKRYQGGWANDLYIFDLQHPSLVQVTNDPRTDRDPMWIGNAIYFNSDRSGVFNLYRYDIATHETPAVTHYKDWDVRWPSADADGQIVYESDGELHVYDTRERQDRALSIVVPADTTTTRPQSVNAADNIEGQVVSPGGERVAIVARGDVFSVPVEHGVTRNLTQSSNAHDREVAWSSDGKRLAYVSDRSGEEELYIQAQDGSTPAEALTAGAKARYYAPRWSADDKHIAFADQTGRLIVVDVATKRQTVIAKDPADLGLDYQWSPDGRFLSYSLNAANNYSSVFIWSVGRRRVTPRHAGKFQCGLAGLGAERRAVVLPQRARISAALSTVEFEFATDRQIGIFAVSLHKGAKNPFGVRDDEPGDAKKDADKDDDKDSDDGKPKTTARIATKRRGRTNSSPSKSTSTAIEPCHSRSRRSRRLERLARHRR